MAPKTMLAAILVEQKKPLVIDQVELPQTLSVGQVLVKIVYSGICGSQLGEIDGAKGPDKFLPHLLGHEGSGEVLEIGPGITRVKPHDHVVLHWMKGAGIEAKPPVYTWKNQPCNAGWVTTFQEYAIVSENRLTTIPHDFDLKTAALFGCAVTTGLGVIVNNAKLTIGESVAVFGAGGVGLNQIQGANLVSAYPIIAIDVHDNRLELARSLGATHTINSKHVNASEKIREIAGIAGVDVAIDNTGIPEVIQQCYELTKPQGRVVLVGVPKKGNTISIYSLPMHFGKKIIGSHGGETKPNEDIIKYINAVKSELFSVAPLISREFTFMEINNAIEQMRNGSLSGRCVLSA